MSAPYRLVVVGAGLAALSALRAGLGDGPLAVLDYQEHAGGFLRPALPAPGFDEAWALAGAPPLPAGVTALFGATAVGLLPATTPGGPHTLLVRQREGTMQLQAQRILIACGGLEATREHAAVPGTRPSGVMTPILAHALLARGYLPGRRCLVYGAGRYVATTAGRLARAGAQVTVVPPPGATGPNAGAGIEVEEPAELASVGGFPRLDRVGLRRGDHVYECEADALLYAVGMIANTHWLAGSGVVLGEQGAIVVDGRYQTSIPGIFAIGTAVAPDLDHASSIAMGAEAASVLAGGRG